MVDGLRLRLGLGRVWMFWGFGFCGGSIVGGLVGGWGDLGFMLLYSGESSVLALLKQAWGLGSFRRNSVAQTL